MSESNGKGFDPKIHSGWKKSFSADKRRKIELNARDGDYLSAARAKNALANVTRDKETGEKARADAKYFFKEYKRINRSKI